MGSPVSTPDRPASGTAADRPVRLFRRTVTAVRTGFVHPFTMKEEDTGSASATRSRIEGRYAVMLDRHLGSARYRNRWPIALVRDSLEEAAEECGATFTRVHRALPRHEFDARKVAPFALVDGRDGAVLDGGIYLISERAPA